MSFAFTTPESTTPAPIVLSAPIPATLVSARDIPGTGGGRILIPERAAPVMNAGRDTNPQTAASAPATSPTSAPVEIRPISAPWFFATKIMGLIGGVLVILFVISRGPKRRKHSLGPKN